MDIDTFPVPMRKTKNLVSEYLDIIEFYKNRRYISGKLKNFEMNPETVMDCGEYSLTR